MLLVNSFLFAQDLNKIGAAGISFLLNSQSGQKNLNHDEKVALSILGSFLNNESNKKHDLNVANASSTKIIQTQTGNQVQLMRDAEGNVYLIQDGMVHKVSSSAINMAVGSKEHRESRKYLPEYDLDKLKKNYYKSPEKNITSKSIRTDTKRTVNSYIQEYENVINIVRPGTSAKYYYIKGIEKKNVYIPKNTNIIIYSEYLHPELKTTFTCKWFQDINDNGLDLDENEEISRVFYKSDNSFYIMVSYSNNDNNPITIKISIYDKSDQLVKVKKIQTSDKGDHILHQKLYTKDFLSGVYSYRVELIRNATQERILKERFQIVE